MKAYPRIAIINLAGDVLAEAVGIEPRDADAFLGEVAHELGALLGVDREIARALISRDVADAVLVPVPECFELSAPHRRLFARDIAARIRAYFTPAASDLGAAA